MKAPVCEVCLKSGIMCPGCENKLKSGAITQYDVDTAKLLYRMEQKALLDHASFERTIVLDDVLLVLTQGSVANLIGRGGRIVRMLSRELGKKVRIVCNSGDVRTVVQDLVFPARIFGVNVLYTKDGEEYTVVIPREDQRKITMDEITLRKAIYSIFQKKINFDFSR